MFPYGLGWPGYQPTANQEVDWGTLARQWMQQKTDVATEQSPMWDPSIPPPTYIPPPPPMSIPPPPLLDRPFDRCPVGAMLAPPPPMPMYSSVMPPVPCGIGAPVRSPIRSAPPLLPDPPMAPVQQPWLVRKQPPTEVEVTTDLKKKRLPAWIREGLEKIEQEKNKKMQDKPIHDNQPSVVQDRLNIELGNNSKDGRGESPSPMESQSSNEEKSDENCWMEKTEPVHCLPEDMPAEEKFEVKMSVLRRVMTELLLSATNKEMKIIVDSEKGRMEKLKEDKPRRLAESAALSNLAKEDSSPSDASGNSRASSFKNFRKPKSPERKKISRRSMHREREDSLVRSSRSRQIKKTTSKESNNRKERKVSSPSNRRRKRQSRSSSDSSRSKVKRTRHRISDKSSDSI